VRYCGVAATLSYFYWLIAMFKGWCGFLHWITVWCGFLHCLMFIAIDCVKVVRFKQLILMLFIELLIENNWFKCEISVN
jgi:hypothetical protein